MGVIAKGTEIRSTRCEAHRRRASRLQGLQSGALVPLFSVRLSARDWKRALHYTNCKKSLIRMRVRKFKKTKWDGNLHVKARSTWPINPYGISKMKNARGMLDKVVGMAAPSALSNKWDRPSRWTFSAEPGRGCTLSSREGHFKPCFILHTCKALKEVVVAPENGNTLLKGYQAEKTETHYLCFTCLRRKHGHPFHTWIQSYFVWECGTFSDTESHDAHKLWYDPFMYVNSDKTCCGTYRHLGWMAGRFRRSLKPE